MRLRVLNQIERNVNATANHGQDYKDIPTHLREAQEDGSVDADLFDEQLLTSLEHRLDPGEDTLGDSGRSVLLVGMLQTGSIDGVVIGAEETEEQGEDDSGADGVSQRGPESFLTQLLFLKGTSQFSDRPGAQQGMELWI